MNFEFDISWDKILSLLQYDASAPMIFNSGLFLFLFVGFTMGYALLSRRQTMRLLYVILFSLYFYYKSSGVYLLLLLFVSLFDYFVGGRIAATESRTGKRWWVAASVAMNLGLLGYFKYTNFFIDIANNLFGEGFLEFQNIFLPIGISFFVFQSMSYTIDLYRGTIKPLERYTDYLFYLSFFPQIVAGPIVRASTFLPQIRRPLEVTRKMFGWGVGLIIIGLIKKAVISDYISLNFVDRVFADPGLYSGVESLMGIYGYALQIYCDFSGYSDMAIGIALLLGFEFPKNFDAPYKSATITEFWRRWHISLSSWLRDYLYISLGGNRKGRLRQYFNLMLTMLLGGLWHGAAVRFVLWGALHGVALALHKMWLTIVPRAKTFGCDMHPLWRVVGVVFTFHLVCLGWLLFRASDMENFMAIVNNIIHNFNFALLPQFIEGYKFVVVLIVAGYLMHFLPTRWGEALHRRVASAPLVVQALLLTATIWLVMQVKSTDIQPFIYFQF